MRGAEPRLDANPIFVAGMVAVKPNGLVIQPVNRISAGLAVAYGQD
jgi:hypothetical protein